MATLPIDPATVDPLPENLDAQVPLDIDIAPTEPTGPEPEEIEKALFDLIEDYESDDRIAHEQLSSECRRFELYWQNIQDIVWDSTNRDWVSASGVLQTARNLDVDPSILDKTIGIYRSYGEIVASALSQTIPTVRFLPADADNGKDVVTARTSTAISQLIQRHNDGPLLFLRALYTKFNQHFVAAYHTVVVDEAYGTVERPQIGLEQRQAPTGMQICPECGMPEPMMDDMSINMGQCPTCGSTNPPTDEMQTEEVPVVKEVLSAPKGRVRIEVYGPRHVKVQPFCKDVRSSPYVILEADLHKDLIAELYPKYIDAESADDTDVRRGDRRPTADNIDSRKIHTLKRCWIRPWAINGIKDPELRAACRSLYPKGAFVVIVDKKVLALEEENLEEHWTFLADPFAEYVHGDPRGKFLVPIQDMINDDIMLALETILHNIPEMYADPDVVDFKQYNAKEARPGQLNQAKAPDGQSLGAGFYQPQGATLSKEVDAFTMRLQEMAQFVVGAPPSIWGGQQEGGSSTLGEYQQSRSQAQQRLGTDWKMLNIWWKEIMEKSVREFRDFMKQMAAQLNDPAYTDHFVTREGENFTNVWIRMEDMQGEVGEAEAETSDQFPVSWEQQRGLLFELLQSPNPTLASIATSPENIGTIRDIIGLYKLRIPGEQDRDKQLFEIQQMLEGMPAEPDQYVDNHQVHWVTTSAWANSPAGREAKVQNPMGYQLVMQHAMMHYMMMQAMMPQQAPEGGGGAESPSEKQGSSEKPKTNGAKGEPPEK